MTHALLPAAARPALPWKNGGGVTREIAVSPPGAGLAGFDWRISMATVAAAGPFSMFPGIDRTLLVLEGGGLTLRIDGARVQVLEAGDEPVTFPGDVPVDAELRRGPVTDLNIMVRRGAWTAEARRLQVTGPTSLPATGDVQVAVALGALRVAGAARPTAFADAVRFEGSALPVAPVAGPVGVILVSLARRSAGAG
jgi:environmental stress-induced protein Ves